MWGMDNLDSDVDVSCVFKIPVKNILSGKSGDMAMKDFHMKYNSGRDLDLKCQEIGHLINQLIKGNVNAVWTVMSPKIVWCDDYIAYNDLRNLVEENISKLMYKSIFGLSTSQMADGDAHIEKREKCYKSAMRTINFGICVFNDHEIKFEPVFGNVERHELTDAFYDLEEAMEKSSLIECPDEEKFREYLFNLRLDELNKM
jgi:predicted nucleotidyltransferase